MWGESVSLGAWLGRLIRVASKGPGAGSDQRTRGRDGGDPTHGSGWGSKGLGGELEVVWGAEPLGRAPPPVNPAAPRSGVIPRTL